MQNANSGLPVLFVGAMPIIMATAHRLCKETIRARVVSSALTGPTSKLQSGKTLSNERQTVGASPLAVK